MPQGCCVASYVEHENGLQDSVGPFAGKGFSATLETPLNAWPLIVAALLSDLHLVAVASSGNHSIKVAAVLSRRAVPVR